MNLQPSYCCDGFFYIEGNNERFFVVGLCLHTCVYLQVCKLYFLLCCLCCLYCLKLCLAENKGGRDAFFVNVLFGACVELFGEGRKKFFESC